MVQLVRYFRDGDRWCVVPRNFVDFQQTPDVWWCDSEEEARGLVEFIHKVCGDVLALLAEILERAPNEDPEPDLDAYQDIPADPVPYYDTPMDAQRSGYDKALWRYAQRIKEIFGLES